MMRSTILAATLMLAACTTVPLDTVTRVPVPVECREKTPDAPVLPVDDLTPEQTLDSKVAAALASIERLRGYVAELLAALTACQKPIQPS